jgi:septal ring factor EnvC (AmiA/AmiB activator)
MTLMVRVLCLFMLLFMLSFDGIAASDKQATQAKINKIKQERAQLTRIRKQLEQQLGDLGLELRKLDSALLKARKAGHEAQESILKADQKLAGLQHERQALQQHVNSLQQQMNEETVAAWQRSARSSQWLGIFTGVSVSDIPHRRYLLSVLMQSQAEDRQVYIQSVQELAKVEADLQQQRNRLVSLQQEKKQAEQGLKTQVSAKQKMTKRVQKDVRSKKKRNTLLIREEKALLGLLENLGENLLAMEKQATSAQHIRRRKGRLQWPLKGKIVASYGSRPSPSMPRLKGVQLKPKGKAKKVRAMAAGQVRYADWFGGFGLMTIVDYGDGVLGVYAHNDALYKQLGDWVEEGETLADVGSTGWVNKVALYFEIRDKGRAVNPKRWCRR